MWRTQLLLLRFFLLVLVLLPFEAVDAFQGDDFELDGDPFAFELVLSQTDTIPLKERFGNFLTDKKNNPFDLKDPAIIEKTVEYDPVTNMYIITETVGDDHFRPPTYLTFEEYMEWNAQQQEKRYFNALSGVEGDRSEFVGNLDPLDKFDLKESLVDRLFGGNTIDIKPQGNVDLTFGGDYEINNNPLLTTRGQRPAGFDFDMAIKMNVTGKIGEKLNLNANYNTGGGAFDFDNQLNLNYDGASFSEDEIIQNVEAGNVSLPLKSSLIQGSQSLFGLKTEMQFGHLRLTALASQQKSKQQHVRIESGAIEQEFEVRPEEYDENRHFFVSHYNRKSYENALKNLPEVSSLFAIKDIEVWVTDNSFTSTNIEFRDIVALSDLATPDRENFHISNPGSIENPSVKKDLFGNSLPLNSANKLYEQVTQDPSARLRNKVVDHLLSLGLEQARDFEKIRARKLSTSEYSYNPELGFISLNIRPKPNQIVAVSYEYRYRGEVYKVGEFSNEIPADSSAKIIFTKMLKSSAQSIAQPSWDLMMKNVYPLGTFGLTNEDFRLDVFYEAKERQTKALL